MINDNLTRDSKPGYNLIEHKKLGSPTIGFDCRHGLNPLSEVVCGHDNVLMSPNRSWVAIYKIHPPLGEGTDGNDLVKRGWVQGHLLSEHLAGVTLLDRFDTIFKNRWPKITNSQYFLGCRKTG
jgi:hypothetical protein